MRSNELSRFENLVKQHRSASHALFVHVEQAAVDGSLSAESYRLFSTNIAARTMLSLPEIHACCIQAALDLDPLRTAFSVMTGAEEGGFGKPAKVHTVLMMNALNHHGRVVYGLPELNIHLFMALIRLLHASRQYRLLLEVQQNGKAKILEDLERHGLVHVSELVHTCRRMAAVSEIELPADAWSDPEEIERVEMGALERLAELKVLPETIDYCLAQLDVLVRMRAGYLQGVGFAHEALADGMIFNMFKILFAQIDHYSSRQEFMEHVHPYFSAHGNYLEVLTGQAKDAEGVEVVHAQRELAKLAQLDNEALESAWVGANDFADRNVRIWDGLLNALKSVTQKKTAPCE
jgi:hypothetical protein